MRLFKALAVSLTAVLPLVTHVTGLVSYFPLYLPSTTS